MATVILPKVFVTLVSTGEDISGYSARDRSQEHEMTGEVRQYAGGNKRAVTSEGVMSTFGFTLRDMSLADIVTLKSWIGLTVQVRDHRGQRFFGTYFKVTPIEHSEIADYDVAITLNVVSYNEEV